MANTPTVIAYAGDAIKVSITVLQTSGAVLDLTGITVIEYALATAPGAAPLVTKTLAGGGISVSAPTTGVFVVSLVEADTSTLVTGNSPVVFYQEALLVDTSGDPVTVYSGYILLYPTSLKA